MGQCDLRENGFDFGRCADVGGRAIQEGFGLIHLIHGQIAPCHAGIGGDV